MTGAKTARISVGALNRPRLVRRRKTRGASDGNERPKTDPLLNTGVAQQSNATHN